MPTSVATQVDANGHSTGELNRSTPLRSRAPKAVIIAGIGTLITFMLVFSILNERQSTVMLAVAAEPIPMGTLVTADMFEVVESRIEPELLVSVLAPNQIERVVGWSASRNIAAGQIVTAGDIRDRVFDDPDLRAFNLPLRPSVAVGGTIEPGDVIDIIEVYDDLAVVLAAEVEVVLVPPPSDGGGGGENVMVVALDHDQVLRVAYALRNSELFLSRSTGSSPADPDSFYQRAGAAPGPAGGGATEPGFGAELDDDGGAGFDDGTDDDPDDGE